MRLAEATVNHLGVTRFFMMIPEACELVIQAEGQPKTRHGMNDAVPVPPPGIAEVRASGMRWGEAQGAA